jgi:hypothetical protein
MAGAVLHSKATTFSGGRHPFTIETAQLVVVRLGGIEPLREQVSLLHALTGNFSYSSPILRYPAAAQVTATAAMILSESLA